MRMLIINRMLLSLTLAAGGTTCEPAKEPAGDTTPLLRFDTASVRLVTAKDTIRLSIELARTREQQTMGLMERRQLAETSGMLFMYGGDQPETAAFWMFRTRIPLDIAFVDSAGVIRAINQMVPCEAATAQGCPTYPPGVGYRAALEMNAGFFERHKAGIGDRLLLGDTAARAPIK